MHPQPVTRLILILFLPIAFFACKKDKPSKPLPLPGTPSGLTVTRVSDTGAVIQWNTADLATSYVLRLIPKTSFRSTLEYKLAGNDALIKTLTELTPATKYQVELTAIGDNGKAQPVTADFTTDDADGLVILGSEDKGIYAFDARNGNQVWRYPTGGDVLATPIIKDSIVYVGGFDGRLYALNAADGSQKWVTRTMRSGSGITAPVALSNGRVYLGDYGGWIWAFDATSGMEQWNYVIPSPYKNVNTAPVILGDTIMYIASYDGRVYAFDLRTGTQKWRTESTGNPITSGPAVYNNTIYVGGTPKLYAFDAGTGAVKWTGYVNGYESFYGSPTISDNKVLIGDDRGIFYAFDASTGAIVWSKKISGGTIMTSAMVANGVVYISNGNFVQAMNVSTGNTVWTNTNIPENVSYSGPTVSEKYVYAGSITGKLYCLDRTTGNIKWSTGNSYQRFQSCPVVLKYSGKTFHPGITGIVQ
ncbi:MAG TPA: PQQ-binding-like beta-propeller repeat protein [Niastella sp.]